MPTNTNSNSNNKNKEPKNSFLLGILSGIAGLSIIGMLIFGTLYLTNKDEKINNEQGEVAGEQQQQQQQQNTNKPVNLAISDSDWVFGNRNAKIKVFEFSDFQCPYCAQFHNVMQQIVEEYPNDVAWIYKQFPIASHPLGMPAAVAAECAGEQNKFWQMADKIFENQQTLTENSFENFVAELDLDVDQYKACVLNNTYRDKIENDYQLGIESGARGTPTNFVNGQMVPGAVPYESMKQMVEELLSK